MKKLLILAIVTILLTLSFSIASASWWSENPSTSMVIPYFNATSGFQTFVLISQRDTGGPWSQSTDNPGVVVKFNPKCGRGQSSSFSLTSKQSFVVTPPQPIEGWVEAFVKSDIADNDYVDGDYPLSGVAVVLDIGNGVAYSINTVQYYEYICPDGAMEPLFYNCDCIGNCADANWGENLEEPIQARLWRNSDVGRTMFVLCDPSGRHLDDDIPDPAPAVGWDPSALYVENRAQLDIYSKSESDAHLTVDWCTGADAGKPGIVTIGVGTTAGPLGTTDTTIANPAATLSDAPYGFGEAYQLRGRMWFDINGDGLMQPGENTDPYAENTNVLGAVLTRISNVYFPNATNAQQMKYYWGE